MLTAYAYVLTSYGILLRVHVDQSFVRVFSDLFISDIYVCVAEGEPAERIKMIMAAFAAFSSVGATIPPSQREDVRGVAILLYSGMGNLIFVTPVLPLNIVGQSY